MRRHRRIIRLAALAALTLTLSGCQVLWDGGRSRSQASTSSLVGFLYGNGQPPPTDAQPVLQTPLRIGVSFLPTNGNGGSLAPTAADRDAVLNAIRDNFKTLPYVTEIVPIPSYYMQASRGDGFTQVEQLSRLNQLDLFALVSYDQITDHTNNKSSLAYITLVGAYFVRGDRHETHTLLDLAVIDPNSRSLVMRAGGTSSLAGNVTAIDAARHETTQRTRGVQLATESLVGNLRTELVDFEARVRAGTAPVKVTRRASGSGGGIGAIDPLLLAFFTLSLWSVLWSRGRRSSASVR